MSERTFVYGLGIDDQGSVVFDKFKKTVVDGGKEVENAFKKVKDATKESGNEMDAFVEKLKGHRSEQRLQNFALREMSHLMASMSMVMMTLGATNQATNEEFKKFTTSLMEGVVVMQTLSFAMDALGVAGGSAIGIVAGVAVAFLMLTGEADKSTDAVNKLRLQVATLEMEMKKPDAGGKKYDELVNQLEASKKKTTELKEEHVDLGATIRTALSQVGAGVTVAIVQYKDMSESVEKNKIAILELQKALRDFVKVADDSTQKQSEFTQAMNENEVGAENLSALYVRIAKEDLAGLTPGTEEWSVALGKLARAEIQASKETSTLSYQMSLMKTKLETGFSQGDAFLLHIFNPPLVDKLLKENERNTAKSLQNILKNPDVDKLPKMFELPKSTLGIDLGGADSSLEAMKAKLATLKSSWEKMAQGTKEATDQKEKIDELARSISNLQAAGDSTAQSFDKLGEIAGRAFSDIARISSQASSAEINALQFKLAKETKAIDDQKTKELKAIEVRKAAEIKGLDVQLKAANLTNEQRNALEARRTQVEASYAMQRDAIDQQYADAKAKREETIQKQISEAKRQEFVANKEIAIGESIINTAVAVTKALEQGGGLFGIPMAAIVGALGLAETVIIASQPVPSFHSGGVVGGSDGGSDPNKEVFSVLKAGETVRTMDQEKELKDAVQGVVSDILILKEDMNMVRDAFRGAKFSSYSWLPGDSAYQIPKFSQGGSFDVPPGFSHDSFPMAVESGERVTVETPDQQRKGSRGAQTFIFNFNGAVTSKQAVKEFVEEGMREMGVTIANDYFRNSRSSVTV